MELRKKIGLLSGLLLGGDHKESQCVTYYAIVIALKQTFLFHLTIINNN